MTEKEKAKAYDKAVERAKKLYGNGITEDIFPELKEDDTLLTKRNKICPATKEQRDALMKSMNDAGYKWNAGTKTLEKLEKSSFHEGDWVVYNNDICQIVKREEGCNKLVTIFGIEKELVNERNLSTARLWTIQDAKEGDILCYKDEISIYKHDIKNCTKQETKFGGFVYYCCYDGKRFITDSFYSLTKQDETYIHLATKEQHDILMKAMNDAGYEWDIEKKELKKNIKI